MNESDHSARDAKRGPNMAGRTPDLRAPSAAGFDETLRVAPPLSRCRFDWGSSTWRMRHWDWSDYRDRAWLKVFFFDR